MVSPLVCFQSVCIRAIKSVHSFHIAPPTYTPFPPSMLRVSPAPISVVHTFLPFCFIWGGFGELVALSQIKQIIRL